MAWFHSPISWLKHWASLNMQVMCETSGVLLVDGLTEDAMGIDEHVIHVREMFEMSRSPIGLHVLVGDALVEVMGAVEQIFMSETCRVTRSPMALIKPSARPNMKPIPMTYKVSRSPMVCLDSPRDM